MNTHPFTSSVAGMRANLATLSANGGGDGPEAVVDGLHAALQLPFRKDSTKVGAAICMHFAHRRRWRC